MTLDLIGIAIQAATVSCSLLTTWLLSKKGKERWGYLIGFVSLPLWVVMETYYGQWLYLVLNPIYFIWWFRGWRNHWKIGEPNMPLRRGKKNIGKNITIEEMHGKPHAQAVAIALDVARKGGMDIPKKKRSRYQRSK